MCRLFLASFFLLLVCAAPAAAQKNEISFMAGGGYLVSANESKPAPAYTLAYTRYLTGHLAVEGAMEIFFVNVPNFGKDDYAGLQGAVLYHFNSSLKGHRFVPYLTAGIGSTSTDFTEIPSEVVVRLGGGFKYFFDREQRLGLRVEARDEIIGKGNTIFYPPTRVNFPSLRAGVILRF